MSRLQIFTIVTYLIEINSESRYLRFKINSISFRSLISSLNCLDVTFSHQDDVLRVVAKIVAANTIVFFALEIIHQDPYICC